MLNKTCEVIADAVALIQPTASGVVMKSELSQAPDRDKIKVSASFTPGKLLREALASAHLKLFSQSAPVGPLVNGAGDTGAGGGGSSSGPDGNEEENPLG